MFVQLPCSARGRLGSRSSRALRHSQFGARSYLFLFVLVLVLCHLGASVLCARGRSAWPLSLMLNCSLCHLGALIVAMLACLLLLVCIACFSTVPACLLAGHRSAPVLGRCDPRCLLMCSLWPALFVLFHARPDRFGAQYCPATDRWRSAFFGHRRVGALRHSIAPVLVCRPPRCLLGSSAIAAQPS